MPLTTEKSALTSQTDARQWQGRPQWQYPDPPQGKKPLPGELGPQSRSLTLPQARPCVRVDTRLGPLPGLPGARPSLCFHEANQEPDEAPQPSQGIERERTPGSRC